MVAPSWVVFSTPAGVHFEASSQLPELDRVYMIHCAPADTQNWTSPRA
jgi:hypothetical protein